MSWWIGFIKPCCKSKCSESINVTYNLSKMMTLANCHPDDMKGKTGLEVATIAFESLKLMRAKPAKFEALNPENGWGQYENIIELLKYLIENGTLNPAAILDIE